MQAKTEEIEVKFYLTNPEIFLERLTDVKALLTSPRILEQDLRFDDVLGNLQLADKVLRLRMDRQASLTYKSSGVLKSGASLRQEFEVKISDFDTGQKLLEALGYHAYMTYEKYRTSYELMQCEVVLDEMPYGWFCEIEGGSPALIRRVAKRLDLNWNARIVKSYIVLFDICKKKLGLTFNDLTFSNFCGIKVAADDFGVNPGDS